MSMGREKGIRKIVSLTPENIEEIISQCERILTAGGIVITPTDTIYGIVGRADRYSAVKKIFALKKRPAQKAFPIFVKSVREARKFAYISDKKTDVLEKIWPGGVSVVFHHKEKLPRTLVGGSDTLGIRIPNYPFLLTLLNRLKFPLTQTSANVSGKPPARNLRDLEEYFGASGIPIDLAIDAGNLDGKQSTVLNFTKNEPTVLRMGIIAREELDGMLRRLR